MLCSCTKLEGEEDEASESKSSGVVSSLSWNPRAKSSIFLANSSSEKDSKLALQDLLMVLRVVESGWWWWWWWSKDRDL